MATREVRTEVLEKSALTTDSPSATTVPRPTEVRKGVSWARFEPKFEPVCSTFPRS